MYSEDEEVKIDVDAQKSPHIQRARESERENMSSIDRKTAKVQTENGSEGLRGWMILIDTIIYTVHLYIYIKFHQMSTMIVPFDLVPLLIDSYIRDERRRRRNEKRLNIFIFSIKLQNSER